MICWKLPLRKGFDKETSGDDGDITTTSWSQIFKPSPPFTPIKFVNPMNCSMFMAMMWWFISCMHLRQGFLASIQLMLRAREGSLTTAGPPCGSFVFLNLFTSGRSKQRPLGFASRSYVREANKILAETYLIGFGMAVIFLKPMHHSGGAMENMPMKSKLG